LSQRIAICSGKGGVGKTFTSISIALALSDLGRDVLLVDADLGLANAQLMLGISPELTIADYVEGNKTLLEVTNKVDDRLKLIPGASGDASLANLPLGALSNLYEEITSTFHDSYIVFDLAAGISNQNMHLLKLCDQRLVLFVDEPASIADSYGVLKLLHLSDKLDHTYLVPNQVKNAESGKKFYERMNHLCLSFLGKPVGFAGAINEDQAVKASIRQRTPINTSFPDSKAWYNVRTIATRIANGVGDTVLNEDHEH
tara:strand:+ start:2101 stop:2871 length:771 start_codon:yes stop_codon:yes gene_type:complete